MFDAPDFADHDEVVFCRDRRAGLRAIIAIHDRTLGPAVGGCRMWPYADETAAVADALRLARAMTFKNALAGLPLGGGKAVVIGDPRRDRSEALLRALGRRVERLAGRYVVAEDVGIGPEELEVVARETGHVAGRAGGSGDPSPFTAHGVFVGMRAAVRHRLGRDSVAGLRVAVQGLGRVGSALCAELRAAGAELVVADPDAAAVRRVREACGADAVDPARILAEDVDVVAPCALGRVLDDHSVPRLRARVVAGAANDQLAGAHHGRALAERGILYAPDYVINAGGIVNVASELTGRYDRARARRAVARIEERLAAIFAEADASGEPTQRVADRMALRRLEAVRAAA